MKYYQNLKPGWRQYPVPSLPSKNKTLVIEPENYAKQDLKPFCSYPVLFDLCAKSH